ncbi:hypothetical protein LT493_08340 [Streptomyces tricolor]|nr:hypothetical protein [Streptomyces tricolor]
MAALRLAHARCRPIAGYVRAVAAAAPGTRVTVVLIPETEPERLWQRLLQNQRARSSQYAVRRETDAADLSRLRFRLPWEAGHRLSRATRAPVRDSGRKSPVKAVRTTVRGGVNRRSDPAKEAVSSNRPKQRTSLQELKRWPIWPRRHRRARGVRAGGPRRQGGDEAVIAENVVGLAVAVAPSWAISTSP